MIEESHGQSPGHEFRAIKLRDVETELEHLAGLMDADPDGARVRVGRLVHRVRDAGGVDRDVSKLREPYATIPLGATISSALEDSHLECLRQAYKAEDKADWEPPSAGAPGFRRGVELRATRGTQLLLQGLAIPGGMEDTSRAFQYAFLDLLDRGLEERSILEERIADPSVTTIGVGGRIYNSLLSSLDVGRVSPYDEESLAREYGMLGRFEISAGWHEHAQPHWYRALRFVTDAFRTLHRQDQKKINRGVEKIGDQKFGQMIVAALIEATKPWPAD